MKSPRRSTTQRKRSTTQRKRSTTQRKRSTTQRKRSTTQRKRSTTQRKRSTTQRKRSGGGQRGRGWGAEDLMSKYGMKPSTASLPPRMNDEDIPEPKRTSRTRDNIANIGRVNRNKCSFDTERELNKCKTVLAGPSERQRCRDVAKDVAAGVTKLTGHYRATMEAVARDCGDKEMTDVELAKCERRIAESSQEYVAQCLNFAGAIESQFGNKTLAGRTKVVKQLAQNIFEVLPGQKQKRELRELREHFNRMIDEWIAKCNQNENLQQARGMEDANITCDSMRSMSESSENDDGSDQQQREQIINGMLARVRR